ncbi:MAG: YbbR-like domain-containing protein [Candidatus Rokubacteria bacterium]|nr:YbbR-like domain-containing protein [Candidatus Rokubacteria bacterium]
MAPRDLFRWITAHWELKLLSLLTAGGLWFLVVSGEKAEVGLSVPMEFHSMPAGLELGGERPETVDVQVQGLRSTLARISGEELRAEVSLAGARAGESTLRLLPDTIRTPKGIKVVRVSPSRIRVVLEPSETQVIRVVPRLTGHPPAGYRVSQVRVNPAEVAVRGPRSEVGRWRQVETDPIDLSGLRGTIKRQASLGPLTNSVRLADEKGVEVTIEVTEETATRRISRVPVQPSSDWKARPVPDSVDVVVRGPLSRVKELTAGQVGVVLNLKGLRPRIYRLAPRITLPPGVELLQVDPPLVTVSAEPS